MAYSNDTVKNILYSNEYKYNNDILYFQNQQFV